MGMKRKLVAGFCLGLLLIGVGGGVTFGEFTSFQYVGERVVGNEYMKQELITRKIPDIMAPIMVDSDYSSDWWDEVKVEADPSLKPDEIVFDLTYNQQGVTIYVEEGVENNRYRIRYAYRDFYGLEYMDDMLNAIINREMPIFDVNYFGGQIIRVAPENVDRVVFNR